MAPIPKPQRTPPMTPVEKAVAEIVKNTNAYPSSVLLTSSKPEVEAALKRAWEQLEREKTLGYAVGVGRPQPVSFVPQKLAPHQVQSALGTMTLEKQLEESLWARATYHTPVFTREALYAHVGPGHMTDDWYVKKVNGGGEVLLLCKCEYILVAARCRFGAERGAQCEEPAFPAEATLKKDARCGLHMKGKS